MKKLLVSFCFLFGAALAVNAQVATEDETQQDQQTQLQRDADQSTDEGLNQESSDMNRAQGEDDADRQLIASSELPDVVRQSLQSEEYSGWTIGNAYRKEKDGETMYAVEVSNGSETKVVKFDAQGNKIKEKDKDNSSLLLLS